jgi:hypothetical protein
VHDNIQVKGIFFLGIKYKGVKIACQDGIQSIILQSSLIDGNNMRGYLKLLE